MKALPALPPKLLSLPLPSLPLPQLPPHPSAVAATAGQRYKPHLDVQSAMWQADAGMWHVASGFVHWAWTALQLQLAQFTGY